MVLDFGGVLVEIHGKRVHDALRTLAPGAPPHLLQGIHTWEAHFEYERGRLGTAAFARAVGDRLGVEITETEFIAAWNQIFGAEVSGIGPLLADVSRSMPLYLLSNTNHAHWEEMQKYAWMAHFRDRFASFQIGARKPDPEVWTIVMERLGVEPREVLFVDDTVENVESARRAGMNAEVCVNSVARLREILAR